MYKMKCWFHAYIVVQTMFIIETKLIFNVIININFKGLYFSLMYKILIYKTLNYEYFLIIIIYYNVLFRL